MNWYEMACKYITKHFRGEGGEWNVGSWQLNCTVLQQFYNSPCLSEVRSQTAFYFLRGKLPGLLNTTGELSLIQLCMFCSCGKKKVCVITVLDQPFSHVQNHKRAIIFDTVKAINVKLCVMVVPNKPNPLTLVSVISTYFKIKTMSIAWKF